MEIRTLSEFPGVPFNDTLETFFDTYKVDEEIECYQLLFSPYGDKTNFDDLYKLKFQSKIVILNVMDLIIDSYDNTAINELIKFCEDHPEQYFIVYSVHLGLKNEISLPNLYLDTIISSNFTKDLIPCEKEKISNKWLSLNLDTKLHKVMTVCYLLSKHYYENGNITFSMDVPTLVKYDQYKNFVPIPSRLKKDFARGFDKFRSKNFNLLKIQNFDKQDDRVSTNYNDNLLPVYKNIGVEIITGTSFFERTPAVTEKEVQSIFGKTFPIYINGIGMVKEMKKLFDLDLFDDIIDNSYDEVENHFERMAAAIDRNQHLLDGSTNIQELWLDNQKRFEDNCAKMTSMFFDRNYQRLFNHQKIKQALTHFKVTYDYSK